MDETLLEYCRQHFATTHSTPFTSEPLGTLLQYDGITLFGKLVYQGRAPLENLPLDDATKSLLTHL